MNPCQNMSVVLDSLSRVGQFVLQCKIICRQTVLTETAASENRCKQAFMLTVQENSNKYETFNAQTDL